MHWYVSFQNNMKKLTEFQRVAMWFVSDKFFFNNLMCQKEPSQKSWQYLPNTRHLEYIQASQKWLLEIPQNRATAWPTFNEICKSQSSLRWDLRQGCHVVVICIKGQCKKTHHHGPVSHGKVIWSVSHLSPFSPHWDGFITGLTQGMSVWATIESKDCSAWSQQQPRNMRQLQ